MTTTTRTAKTPVPVFRAITDWDSPAPGVWEAVATPHTIAGRGPFEATITDDPNTDTAAPNEWVWALYRPETDDPAGYLIQLAEGRAPTLAEAKRQVEHNARAWRDNPPDPHTDDALVGLTHDSPVTCSACGTTYSIWALEDYGGRCYDPATGGHCDSEIFDGHHITDLIEAVY